MDYLSEAVNALLETHCASVADDEWDLDGLAKELKTFWPNSIDEDHLAECRNTDQMYDLVMADATKYYEQREAELGEKVMREVERQVMLRIIDQRWREHLEEMDYLKEGINLRAMGQKDPLTEWQREGYEMFGAMMKGIAQDFVRYVMHVQVVRNEPAPAAPVQNVTETSAEDEPSGFQRAATTVAEPTAEPVAPVPAAPTAIGQAPARATAQTATRAPGRQATTGGICSSRQAGDGREGRMVEDPSQRTVPVRVGQEVQDVSRRFLSVDA